MLKTSVSLLLGLCLLLGGIARADDQDKGKKADRPVRGTIVKIDKESSQGTVLTVQVMAGKKDDAATDEKQEKKFTLTSSTKVEKVSGKKDNVTHEDAKADDLRTGQHVMLTVKGDKVEKVAIMPTKKKDKTK